MKNFFVGKMVKNESGVAHHLSLLPFNLETNNIMSQRILNEYTCIFYPYDFSNSFEKNCHHYRWIYIKFLFLFFTMSIKFQ